MWNPLEKLKQKITGAVAPVETVEAAKPKDAKEAPPGMPDLKELEKKGMMSQFFRHWKNPAFLKQVQAVAARMQAEGVDVKDQKAVMAWVQAHQKELEAGGGATPSTAPKQETFVKTGPDIGRNDPCTCGSGKKYKKCHGR